MGAAASMGPQLVRCGMTHIAKGSGTEAWLQWGRNLFVAECCSSVIILVDSRKRLQWGRNLFVAECSRRLFVVLMNGVVLQWGRNLFVAECSHRLMTGATATSGFNGGRNLFVAECCWRSRLQAWWIYGFNGAATCSLRNGAVLAVRGRRGPASMGPQLVRCGMLVL